MKKAILILLVAVAISCNKQPEYDGLLTVTVSNKVAHNQPGTSPLGIDIEYLDYKGEIVKETYKAVGKTYRVYWNGIDRLYFKGTCLTDGDVDISIWKDGNNNPYEPDWNVREYKTAMIDM